MERRHSNAFALRVGTIVTALCCAATAAAAQTDSGVLRRPVAPFHTAPDEPGPVGASDWSDVRLTLRFVGHRMTHPSLEQGLVYAGIAAGAFYLERHKYDLAGEFQARRGDATNDVSGRVRPLGEAIVPLAALSTYFIGRFTGSQPTRRAGLILSESAALTALATAVGQYVLSEQRPEEGGRLSFFRPGGHGVSGHTSIIASMSVPLDRLFFTISPDDGGWVRAAKWIGRTAVYAAPVATGWSRMNDDKHFAWNVLLGLGAGFVMGDLVSQAHGLGRRGDDSRSFSVVPFAAPDGSPGLALRWTTR